MANILPSQVFGASDPDPPFLLTAVHMREFTNHVRTTDASNWPSSISEMKGIKHGTDLNPSLYYRYLTHAHDCINNKREIPELYSFLHDSVKNGMITPGTPLLDPSTHPNSCMANAVFSPFNDRYNKITPTAFSNPFAKNPKKIELNQDSLAIFMVVVKMLGDYNEEAAGKQEPGILAKHLVENRVVGKQDKEKQYQLYLERQKRAVALALMMADRAANSENFFDYVVKKLKGKARMNNMPHWHQVLAYKSDKEDPFLGGVRYDTPPYIIPIEHWSAYQSATLKAMVFLPGKYNSAEHRPINDDWSDRYFQVTLADRFAAIDTLSIVRLDNEEVDERVLVEKMLLHMGFLLKRLGKKLPHPTDKDDRKTLRMVLNKRRKDELSAASRQKLYEADSEGFEDSTAAHLQNTVTSMISHTRDAALRPGKFECKQHIGQLYPDTVHTEYPKATSGADVGFIRSLATGDAWGVEILTPTERHVLYTAKPHVMHNIEEEALLDSVVAHTAASMPKRNDEQCMKKSYEKLQSLNTDEARDNFFMSNAMHNPEFPEKHKLYSFGGFYDSVRNGMNAVKDGWNGVDDSTVATIVNVFGSFLHHSKANVASIQAALGVDKVSEFLTEAACEAQQRLDACDPNAPKLPHTSLELVLEQKLINAFTKVLKQNGCFDDAVQKAYEDHGCNATRAIRMIEEAHGKDSIAVFEAKKVAAAFAAQRRADLHPNHPVYSLCAKASASSNTSPPSVPPKRSFTRASRRSIVNVPAPVNYDGVLYNVPESAQQPQRDRYTTSDLPKTPKVKKASFGGSRRSGRNDKGYKMNNSVPVTLPAQTRRAVDLVKPSPPTPQIVEKESPRAVVQQRSAPSSEDLRLEEIKKRLALITESNTLSTQPKKTERVVLCTDQRNFTGHMVFLPSFVSCEQNTWNENFHKMVTTAYNLEVLTEAQLFTTCTNQQVPLSTFIPEQDRRESILNYIKESVTAGKTCVLGIENAVAEIPL